MRLNPFAIIIFFSEFQLILCETVLDVANEEFVNPDTPTIERIFQAINEDFFWKEKTVLEIIIIEPDKFDYSSILDVILDKLNGTLSYSILKLSNITSKYYLKYPTIFLIPNAELLYDILRFRAVRYQNQAFKYFIYIMHTTLNIVANHPPILIHESLTMTLGLIFYHVYIIINGNHVVTISTLNYFLRGCNKLALEIVYIFYKPSMTWARRPKGYEKFLQYNRCELKMMLPTTYKTDLFSYHWGYATLNQKISEGFTVHGITTMIFKIAGKKYNFTDAYAPVMLREKDWILTYNSKNLMAVNSGTKRAISDPNVYFDITGVHASTNSTIVSNTFYDIKYDLLVTPGDLYTPYEKLFLPFDLITWILIVVTFVITFTTIFVINRLPPMARDLVYGKKNSHPTLNVVCIFFGIAQTKLPTGNFSRFILILFIIFCLIFRTCFQSKSFQFLTSKPRRSPPKSVEDLIAQNYTIQTLEKPVIEKYIEDERDYWPKISEPKLNQYIDYYKTQSQNSTAKMCLIIEDMLRNDLDAIAKPKWNVLDIDSFYTSHQAFIFQQESFYFRMMLKTVNSLVDTGIMKYLLDNYLFQKRFESIPEQNKVLDLNDLSFGFKIWLGFCFMSWIAFLMELMIKPRISKVRKRKKLARIHPYREIRRNVKFRKFPKRTYQNFKIRKRY